MEDEILSHPARTISSACEAICLAHKAFCSNRKAPSFARKAFCPDRKALSLVRKPICPDRKAFSLAREEKISGRKALSLAGKAFYPECKALSLVRKAICSDRKAQSLARWPCSYKHPSDPRISLAMEGVFTMPFSSRPDPSSGIVIDADSTITAAIVLRISRRASSAW